MAALGNKSSLGAPHRGLVCGRQGERCGGDNTAGRTGGVQKYKLGIYLLGIIVLCLFTGCAKAKDPLEKIKDLEFTVLAEDNVPEELKKVIEEKKMNAFKVTYQDNGFLYICVGYGEQVSGGYSITVNDLYLTENAIYVDTTLIGPDPSDAAPKKNTQSYPYIVIKAEFVDKPVVFK